MVGAGGTRCYAAHDPRVHQKQPTGGALGYLPHLNKNGPSLNKVWMHVWQTGNREIEDATRDGLLLVFPTSFRLTHASICLGSWWSLTEYEGVVGK